MPTGKSSKPPSATSKKRSRRPTAAKTGLAEGLLAGVRQAAAHFRGEIQLRSYEYNIPEEIDVRALRRRTGLSQSEFAGRYALNPRTVQEWEQGRAEPDLAVRAYLTVIDHNPQAVEEALAAATGKNR